MSTSKARIISDILDETGLIKSETLAITAGGAEIDLTNLPPLPDNKIQSSGNWNAAFGWGDHSAVGYQLAATAITTSNISSQTVANADKLTTARSISLAGNVTGTVSFDGSSNVSITATVADNSHNHTIANVTGLQTALDGKVAITDIVDNLTSNNVDKPLSANQGKILNSAIDNINAVLQSDDTDLDELQEIVDFIKLNRADLDTLGIANIAGLQNALNDKVDKVTGKGLSTEDYTTAEKNKLAGIAPGADTGTVTSVSGGDGLTGTVTTSGSLAVDGTVVRTTGDQTVGGVKTFSANSIFNGNVGIGTSTPSSKLHIIGTGEVIKLQGAAPYMQFVDAANNNKGYLESNAAGINLGAEDGNPIRFIAAGERMRITSAGNVGIGTSSPRTKLDVHGVVESGSEGSSSTGSVMLRSRRSDAVFNFINTWGSLRSSSASYMGFGVKPSTSVANAFVGGVNDTAGVSAVIAQNGFVSFETGPIQPVTEDGAITIAERLRITSAGNVGIGTSNPVINSSGRTLHIHTPTAGHWSLLHTTNNESGSGGADGTIYGQIGLDGYVFNYEAGNIIFGTNSAQRMRIDSAGNVGIGTSSPASVTNYKALTLDGVNGTFTDYRENTALRLRIGGDAGSGFINGQAGTLRFLTIDAERMRIDSAGNVGIGTSSPTHRLHVNGPQRVGNHFTFSGQLPDINNNQSYIIDLDLQACGNSIVELLLTGTSTSGAQFVMHRNHYIGIACAGGFTYDQAQSVFVSNISASSASHLSNPSRVRFTVTNNSGVNYNWQKGYTIRVTTAGTSFNNASLNSISVA